MRVRAAASALLVTGAAIIGPTLMSSPASAASGVSAQDRSFLVAAHQTNLAEIASGKVAEQKGADAAVREHGARFVTDHTRLDASLRAAAKSVGVSLPTTPNAKQQAQAAALVPLRGHAFDVLWTTQQIAGHRAALAAGRLEIAQGSNSEVVGLAKSSGPVVSSHLSMLLASAGEIGVPTSVGAGQGPDRGLLPLLLLAGGTVVATSGALALRRR